MADSSKRSAESSALTDDVRSQPFGASIPEEWMSQMRVMLREENSLFMGKVRMETQKELKRLRQELHPAVQRWDAGMERLVDLTTRVRAAEQAVPKATAIAEAIVNSLPKAKSETHSMEVFGGLTVGEMLSFGPEHAVCKLREDSSLGDLAESLTASGQTAAAVSDMSGDVVGLLTENDIMRAYFEGISPDRKLDDWLASGLCRAPGQLLERLMVRQSAPLAEVAQKMVANAVAGDCACHHAVVYEDGRLYGVLSAHDLSKALCRPEMREHHHLVHEMGLQFETADSQKQDALEAAVDMTVLEVMKPLELVFTCKPSSSMKDVVKVLLTTQQNSTLVADEDGIAGIVTPRDVLKAFLDCVSSDVNIFHWLRGPQPRPANRVIASNAGLVEVAAAMADRNLNHLVVVHPGTMRAVGVVSSLDLVLRTRAHKPLTRVRPFWRGPTLGELVTQPIVCKNDVTLGAAAKILAGADRTSVVVQFGGDDLPTELLTEDDLLRAYVSGCPQSITLEVLLKQRLSEALTLFVQPRTPLTDAATCMLAASDPGRPCHHLVVMKSDQDWVGVFSALDFARALLKLGSELDIVQTGVDHTTVGMVMKPRRTVPTCNTSDSIHDALSTLISSGQNAAFVVDERGKHNLITPRCAVQAMAEGVPKDRSVAQWLKSRADLDGPREVGSGMLLLEVAAIMTEYSLHHLVVIDPPSTMPVGVLSSLDLVRSISSIHCHCPFVSLAWLRRIAGPNACSLRVS